MFDNSAATLFLRVVPQAARRSVPRSTAGSLPVVSTRGGVVTHRKADLLQGTLDLLILKTLALESLHGWGLSKRIRQLSGEVLEVNQGSLYPALYRLRDRGLIRSRWDITEEDRRVKVYELTRAGREALEVERDRWRVFAGAMERVLGTA
ncbi:MAG: PadR family transcriptional regulator [Gemmatimonadota bacterium]|nr:MAG: PadR family transcriptional regulator [Gemmatimonadota bacterium]